MATWGVLMRWCLEESVFLVYIKGKLLTVWMGKQTL